MCFYCRCEKIAHSKNGHVLRDQHHKYYALQFGNVDIMMVEKQLSDFSKFLNSLSDDKLIEMSNVWNNKITLKQHGFMGGYSFEKEEFYEFRDLVNEVIAQIVIGKELKKILNS